jgi:hypothetical protein
MEQIRFLSPFKFYRHQPRTLTLHADFGLDGDDIVADCRLVGIRTLHGQAQAETTIHFTGRVWLVHKVAPARKRKRMTPPGDAKKVNSEEIYKLYFHGQAYRVLECSWKNNDEIIGLFAEGLPANHEPAESSTLVSPRVIELCFQTAGIWEMAAKSRMGLPFQIGQISFLRPPENAKSRLYSVVKPADDGSFDAHVIDERGNIYLVLRGYQTMELPDPIDVRLLEPLKNAMA